MINCGGCRHGSGDGVVLAMVVVQGATLPLGIGQTVVSYCHDNNRQLWL